MSEDEPIDLEFPPHKPAVSAMHRRHAKAEERAEQQQDDEREGPLWDLDRGKRPA